MKIYNDRYEVTFCKEGGEICSFLDKETGMQYMYQGDSPYWGGKNPTLFPIVGNTYDGTYETKGKTYSFKNHGLIRYAVLECVKQEGNSITFELKANEETLKAYPYLFTYHITYILEGNQLTVRYDITNDDEDVMPFTFGLHPGFRVPLEEGECYEDYKLSFEEEETLEQLVFDLEKKDPHHFETVTMKDLQLDYGLMRKYATLIYKGYKSAYVTLQGKGEHGVKVSIAGFPLLAIWSPDQAPFLCIEPWYSHADFEKLDCRFEDRMGMMKLQSKDTFTTSYTIEVF